jgi:hypothetical protein
LSSLLTDLERAGGHGVLYPSATLAERNALHLHIQALKAQGHAIAFSDTIERENKGRTISVQHYKTCEECKRRVI